MAHPYFQEDEFVNNFEVELKRLIDEEREKEAIDRNKRRKHRKVSLNVCITMKHAGTGISNRESRGSLDEIENGIKKRYFYTF